MAKNNTHKRKFQESASNAKQPYKKVKKVVEEEEEESSSAEEEVNETTLSDNDSSSEDEEVDDGKLNVTDGYEDFALDEIDWKKQKLDAFNKNLYKEHAQVKKMSQKQVEEFRAAKEIKVIGEDVPNPILEFEQVAENFPVAVMQTIHDSKFEKPTPIQSQSWPIVLKGRDMIGLAETGSGKTVAFLLPAIAHLLQQKPVEKGEGPVVLILAPTRELAMQIQTEAYKYGLATLQEHNKKKVPIKSACVYGGDARRKQITELKQSPQIVIATPGRLLDFLQAKITNLKRVTYLVLDEADRMLDMGFAPQIAQIISQIRQDRQTTMFSATWDVDVQELAQKYLQQPLIVNIGSVGMAANRNVDQKFLFIQESDKPARILKLIDEIMDGEKILIFTMTKNKTDYITSKLREEGWPALSLHGARNQKERDWVINEFRTGETPLLVATDVAARGLDIQDIKYVINYDMPKNIDTYVHRIGRTGRAQKKGQSISLFTPNDVGLCKPLIQMLKKSNSDIPAQLTKLKKLTSTKTDNK